MALEHSKPHLGDIGDDIGDDESEDEPDRVYEQQIEKAHDDG